MHDVSVMLLASFVLKLCSWKNLDTKESCNYVATVMFKIHYLTFSLSYYRWNSRIQYGYIIMLHVITLMVIIPLCSVYIYIYVCIYIYIYIYKGTTLGVAYRTKVAIENL
jgi:hypothetical protein